MVQQGEDGVGGQSSSMPAMDFGVPWPTLDLPC
jgi:hypothetical protein